MSSAFHHAPNGEIDGYKLVHGRVIDAKTEKEIHFMICLLPKMYSICY